MVGIQDNHPEYLLTSPLDTLRSTEYSFLDEQNHVYLDYTGSGLAAKSQHQSHNERVTTTVFGNPHSINPTSEAATKQVEKTRARVLSHLNASPDEYIVIFTPNATGAARLVGEAYPFTKKTKFLLTADNHNSINGIREYAKSKGAKTTYIPLTTPDLRVDNAALLSTLSSSKPQPQPQRQSNPRNWLTSLFTSCLGSRSRPSKPNPPPPPPNPLSSTSSQSSLSVSAEKSKSTPKPQQIPPTPPRTKGLFAYPAQSNFSGTRHPLSYIPLAQSHGYDVLLDAAAYLPTSPLDLSGPYKPDFVIASFYKLFGYPTGVGCLVARRDALSRLKRPWFSGGTIKAVTVAVPWHQMVENSHEMFEDGTVNFSSIPDVAVGLDFLTERVGMNMLDIRVRCLTSWFLERLGGLRHSDGKPMAVIYGPRETSCEMRGGTVAFNLLDLEGKVVDERLVAYESAAEMISLRTGCFCNPGAGEAALGVTREILEEARGLVKGWERGGKEFDFDEFLRGIRLPTAGAIRVSFGAVSNVKDVERFFGFVEGRYRDRVTSGEGLPYRVGC